MFADAVGRWAEHVAGAGVVVTLTLQTEIQIPAELYVAIFAAFCFSPSVPLLLHTCASLWNSSGS